LLALKAKYKEITGNDFGPPTSSGKKKKSKAAAAAPPKPAPKPAPVPLESISDGDLETCIKVLDALGADATCIEDPRFKLLRRSVMPIVQYMRKKMFKGAGSMTEYLEKQHIRREAEGRKAKQKALDQKHINSVKLRSARVDNLRRLQAETPGLMNVPLIADGQATSAVNISLIADGPAAPTAAQVGEAGDAEQTEAEVADPRSCYVCKGRFTKLHFFYDQMCPDCAALNFTKREQLADLTGQVALVTGARIKIGMCVALKLLACGCTVIATTRFPHDAALRFAKEPNYQSFCNRLHLYPLDLRDVAHVKWFASHLVQRHGRVDIVIHNACQTIRRPPAYYAHLLDRELSPATQLTQEQASSIKPTLRMCIEAEQQLGNRALAEAGADAGSSGDGGGDGSGDGTAAAAAATPASTADMPTMPTPVVSAIQGHGMQDMPNHSCAATALKSQVVLTAEDRSLSGSAGGVQTSVQEPGTVAGADNQLATAASAAAASAAAAAFPRAMLDVNEQQVDLRRKNTWMLTLEEVDPLEAAEVLAINTLAPFVLNSLLVPHMGANSITRDGMSTNGEGNYGDECGNTEEASAAGGGGGGGLVDGCTFVATAGIRHPLSRVI
jgi:NAD(P)-dependent dehydrogenase (short-subunit alcohol dehydrogenase family)